MSVFQIWGQFTKDDPDQESPTTVSMFKKGQLMGNGQAMEDFEREYATNDGEVLVLLREFEIESEALPSETVEFEMARAVYNAFMDGWWHIIQKDPHGHGKNE